MYVRTDTGISCYTYVHTHNSYVPMYVCTNVLYLQYIVYIQCEPDVVIAMSYHVCGTVLPTVHRYVYVYTYIC